MLYVHEVHSVRGSAEDEFEAAIRDEWLPTLADGGEARLLWYCTQIHGTGPAYTVITVTAVRDGDAWEKLARRLQAGDLRDWQSRLDALRHDVTTTLLLPVPWSPMQDVDFATVPTRSEDHDPSIYMEDTGWPHAPLADYVEFWGRGYHAPMQQRPRSERLLDIEACFQPAYGGGRRKEAMLWQKVLDHDRLLGLLTAETPPERKAAGTFMHDALNYRDQWRSRLLRTSRWSPLW